MNKRLKRVIINAEVFFIILKNESGWKVVKGIPKDAELRGVTLDPYTQTLNLFIEHESFEAVSINSPVPILETEFLRIK